jgi:peptidyl-dipeptidase Dcp
MSKNPLLVPFETPPFHLIKNEHYKPAFETAVSLAKEEIAAVKKQSDSSYF